MTPQRSTEPAERAQEEQDVTDKFKKDVASSVSTSRIHVCENQSNMTQQAWLDEIVGYDTGWNVQAAGYEDGTMTAELHHPATRQLVPVLLALESFPSPELRRAEVFRQIAEKEQAS